MYVLFACCACIVCLYVLLAGCLYDLSCDVYVLIPVCMFDLLVVGNVYVMIV